MWLTGRGKSQQHTVSGMYDMHVNARCTRYIMSSEILHIPVDAARSKDQTLFVFPLTGDTVTLNSKTIHVTCKQFGD